MKQREALKAQFRLASPGLEERKRQLRKALPSHSPLIINH